MDDEVQVVRFHSNNGIKQAKWRPGIKWSVRLSVRPSVCLCVSQKLCNIHRHSRTDRDKDADKQRYWRLTQLSFLLVCNDTLLVPRPPHSIKWLRHVAGQQRPKSMSVISSRSDPSLGRTVTWHAMSVCTHGSEISTSSSCPTHVVNTTTTTTTNTVLFNR